MNTDMLALVVFAAIFQGGIVESRSPIVIVPGTLGSQIYAKLVNKPKTVNWYCWKNSYGYFRLWVDIPSFAPKMSNCWADNMRLEWNMKDLTVSNSPGVVTQVPGFGDTWSMETLDRYGFIKYMKPMVEYFVSKGYVRGKDIRGAPYDFRYSPDQIPDNYYNRLKQLIEESYILNGNTSITLVTHSYGGLIALYFISLQTKQWKKKYLKQWFPLAAPFGGSMEMVRMYALGDFEGVPSFLFNKDLQIHGQRSSTGNLFLLPTQEFWPKDKIIATTQHRTYNIGDLDEFLRDVGFPEGAVMRKNIISHGQLVSKAPGIKTFCLFGEVDNSTTSQLIFGDDFPKATKETKKGPGDGTVNLGSLDVCKRFSNEQKEPVYLESLKGTTHSGIIYNSYVLNFIHNRL